MNQLFSPFEHFNPASYFTTPSIHEIFKYYYQIKELDLDVFGHVNNANYLRMYEEARWDFITRKGFGLEKIMRDQQGPVLLDVHVSFRRELKSQEPVMILSQTEQVGDKKSVLNQLIVKQDGKLASSAKYLVGFFDLTQRKLLTPHPDWLKAIGVESKT